MWLTSKIKQIVLALSPGTVTLKYPFVKKPVPRGFRGQPVWDHTKCIGCGGCANHCPARTILLRDLCQEIRVLLYDGSRCTYCGRCADLCPEKAIVMSPEFELAAGRREDVSQTVELFMLTCNRCGRCFDMEIKNAIDKLDLRGYRYDSLEARTVLRRTTDRMAPEALAETEAYRRPEKIGGL
ncbi:MAG: 4Fe-4S binding protein [Acidobacteriota bacterium]|nr:4Fe-4S binding protein [Acidobacteriota bacterium]HOF82713.1 4Fe-4S binding protein [Candidatus Aminicenantes bacterium]MDD8033766.1 4Fe-4S binding protein [Acidobacteriota bacterium]MDD8039162.1 4Fe-4S binding protein [Acidobacteriota bacterium]MDW3226965.1 4Fe-4S binding protein [Acidobacteriota bacterium]